MTQILSLRILSVVFLTLSIFSTCANSLPADDWPQWRGVNRDGWWLEDGIRDDLPDGQLPLAWSVEIGPGYSGPTVANGKVYVTDRQVLTDEKTSSFVQTERVLCFDSANGTQVWKYEYAAPYKIDYEAGPRASVTIDQGYAYVVGAMGHFHCLDALTGKLNWSRDLQTQYDINMPIWGIAASPVIYNDLVIQQVGGSNGACMVAFNKLTGAEAWKALDDRASYSSPIIIEQAGKKVLVCWTGDSLSGLDPLTGQVFWAHPFPPSRMPIGIGAPVLDGDLLYVSSFYDGSLMVRVPKDRLEMQVAWRVVGKDEQHTEALHAMIGTSILHGGYVYGVDSYGEFRCLDANNGNRIWEDLTAVPKARWSTIHMVRQSDRIWMFNERGELMIAKLSPKGLEIIDRCQLIEPTTKQLRQRGGVCWTHPAYAEKSIFVRNDNKLVRASLAK